MRVPTHQLSDDPILRRIIDAIRDSGKTEKSLIDHLQMVRGTFSSWRYKNVKSYMSRIDDIANFLNVSPNYLLRGIDDEVNIETLSEAEIQRVKKYRQADDAGKSYILMSADYVSRDAVRDAGADAGIKRER